MLIETEDPGRSKGTLSQHSPKSRNIYLCTTQEEIGKRTLHNWWRISVQQVFYPAKGKLNKDKEGRNLQPAKTSGKGQH